MSTTENPTQEPTIEELEAMLAKKKKAESQKRQREQKEYELNRDLMIGNVVGMAVKFQGMLAELKEKMHEEMEKQHTKLSEYGGIPRQSKGGFKVTHSNGLMRVKRIRSTDPIWDERSDLAIELIKEFLGDTVKKRSKKLFEILISFLERNNKGDLEYAKVMGLLKHRDKYDDERWLEGLRLLEESYTIHFKAYSYLFQVKEKEGDKWETISLNFSSL